MVDQTLPEIVAVHEKNKAIRHEAIKKQKKEQLEKELEDQMLEMNNISNDYYKAKDDATKQSLANEWYNKLKLYAKKIEEIK